MADEQTPVDREHEREGEDQHVEREHEDREHESVGAFDYDHSHHGLPVDEEGFKQWQEHAKSLGLTPEQFKSITDFGIADIKKVIENDGVGRYNEDKNRRETMADRDLSEDGRNLRPEVRNHIDAVFDRFGDDDAKDAMARAAVGSHPAVVRMFHRMGEGMEKAEGERAPANAHRVEHEEKPRMADRLFGRKDK